MNLVGKDESHAGKNPLHCEADDVDPQHLFSSLIYVVR